MKRSISSRGGRGKPDLVDLKLELGEISVPGDVRSFVREAERRIERFQRTHHIPGFVPSDFYSAYGILRALAGLDLSLGNSFCEWGSGFGVVACLASMLDFDARGIEIEGELVDAAQRLAEDFGLPVEFVRGSFIPAEAESFVEAELEQGDGFAWLTIDGTDILQDSETEPADFDLIFAYPWPDEEGLTEALFGCYAPRGAVLATYHGGEDYRVRRKTDGRRKTA